MTPLVLKLGGELLETPEQRARIATLAAVTLRDRPLVIVHGGGRAIDVELKRRGIAPKKVDGLRVTDAETLDVVVAVLAGSSNTALVAACVAKGARAVGLTGVDAGFGRAVRTAAHAATDGSVVDLGFVGDPVDAHSGLIRLLLASGYVPVIASIGIDQNVQNIQDGQHADSHETPSVLNVNADVMACRIAASLIDSDLVIAGGTPGVLDGSGTTISALDLDGIDSAIVSGTATAGMVAKLSACRAALTAGVASVRIIDGRALDATHGITDAPGTLLTQKFEVRT